MHVLVGVAAVVVVTSMIVTGLQPDAGLEGLLVFFGAVLAVPTVVYVALAVRLLLTRMAGRLPSPAIVAALVVLDVLTGAACLAGLPSGAQPFGGPWFALLVVGVALLGLAVATWRSRRNSTPPLTATLERRLRGGGAGPGLVANLDGRRPAASGRRRRPRRSRGRCPRTASR